MISKEFVYDKVLPLVKEKGRMIDYYLIKSLFENVDKEILKELKTYQNEDLGFGHGLEPDVQMPESSIVSADMAVSFLGQIRDVSLKENMIKDIVSFYESQYDKEKDGFKLINKHVKNHPHAFWWTYEKYDEFFPYGNPDGEVIGFLFKHRKYLKKLDINKQINNMISFILSDEFLESSMHTLMSALLFHKYVDQDVKNLIHEQLHKLTDKLLEEDKNKKDYKLEVYKVYLIDPHFTEDHQDLLKKNLLEKKEEVEGLQVFPDWTWGQYDDVFETKVKYEWMGHIYYNLIKALRLHRNI